MKFLIYLKNDKIHEFSPTKMNIKGSYFRQYFFIKTIMQPYLNAYLLIYLILKKKTEYKTQIIFNVNIISKFIKNIIIRIISGISLNIFKKAKYMSIKLLNVLACNSDDYAGLYFFNLTMDELIDTNQLERLRIYKNQSTPLNFNPKKEELIKLFNKLFPKVILEFPDTLEERKISSIILESAQDTRAEALKGFLSIKKSPEHYGTLYNVGYDKEGIYMYGTNYTSQEKTFEQPNFALKEDSYVLKTYILGPSKIKINPSKILTEIRDSRTIAEEFYLQEKAIIASLGLEEPNYLMYNTKEQRFCIENIEKTNNETKIKTLAETIKTYGAQISKSSLYEIDFKLREAHSKIIDSTPLTQERVFKWAVTALLEKPEYFEKLKFLADQIDKPLD